MELRDQSSAPQEVEKDLTPTAPNQEAQSEVNDEKATATEDVVAPAVPEPVEDEEDTTAPKGGDV